MLEKFKDRIPDVAPSSYVHESAHVIGDVTLQENTSVFAGAVIRGDNKPIFIGANSNIQENAVLHEETKIGNFVTVGHAAIVHGAVIEDNCLIGMGAIILDGSIIGKGSIIGAGCVIPPNKNIPPLSVVVGNPYKIIRSGDIETEKNNIKNAKEYVELAKIYKNNKL